MSAFVKLLAMALVLSFGCAPAAAAVHPVPKGGLDNLVRIARWAQKLKVGIYFGAEGP
jgi:hypothetical protein